MTIKESFCVKVLLDLLQNESWKVISKEPFTVGKNSVRINFSDSSIEVGKEILSKLIHLEDYTQNGLPCINRNVLDLTWHLEYCNFVVHGGSFTRTFMKEVIEDFSKEQNWRKSKTYLSFINQINLITCAKEYQISSIRMREVKELREVSAKKIVAGTNIRDMRDIEHVILIADPKNNRVASFSKKYAVSVGESSVKLEDLEDSSGKGLDNLEFSLEDFKDQISRLEWCLAVEELVEETVAVGVLTPKLKIDNYFNDVDLLLGENKNYLSSIHKRYVNDLLAEKINPTPILNNKIKLDALEPLVEAMKLGIDVTKWTIFEGDSVKFLTEMIKNNLPIKPFLNIFHGRSAMEDRFKLIVEDNLEFTNNLRLKGFEENQVNYLLKSKIDELPTKELTLLDTDLTKINLINKIKLGEIDEELGKYVLEKGTAVGSSIVVSKIMITPRIVQRLVRYFSTSNTDKVIWGESIVAWVRNFLDKDLTGLVYNDLFGIYLSSNEKNVTRDDNSITISSRRGSDKLLCISLNSYLFVY